MAINYAGTTERSEFSYDGLSRLVKVVEKTGTTVNSTSKFVWCGNERCEIRNANNVVTLWLYPQGQYASNTPYFYTRDHLGSVREMFKSDGTLVARYDYDPWGTSTASVNMVKPDTNFTGLYRHVKSNLDFATYRAYDPDLGRWLNRDPLEDAEFLQGPNLYPYVNNDPINLVDPDGRFAIIPLAVPWIVEGLAGTGAGLWVLNQAANAINNVREKSQARKANRVAPSNRRQT